MCLKHSSLNVDTLPTGGIYKVLIEMARFSRRRGGIKTWTSPLTDIAVKRKLRNNEEATSGLAEVNVHLSLRVFKDTQAEDFLNQIFHMFFGVAPADAKESQQSVPYGSGDGAVNGYTSG